MDEAIARLCRIARARPRFFSNTGGLQGDSFPPPPRPGANRQRPRNHSFSGTVGSTRVL